MAAGGCISQHALGRGAVHVSQHALGRGCLPGGVVSARGVSAQGGVSAQEGVNRMTDACEKNSLPQLRCGR